MNRGQIIKEYLFEYLSEKGYSYIVDRDIWDFNKKEGRLEKSITIHDMYGTSVQFNFSTTIGCVPGIPLMDKSKVRFNNLGFCEYQNEEEFREILKEIKRIVVERGEEIFAGISTFSDEQLLFMDLEKQLFDEHEKLAEQGKELLMITNETDEEEIKIITEKIKTLHGKKVQEIKEELLMLAAVYGQIYEMRLEGTWVYDADMCLIEVCGREYSILSQMYVCCIKHSSYGRLLEKYQYMKETYERIAKEKGHL